MSYVINNRLGPDSGRLRRRMLCSAVAICVVALLVAAFLIGRQGTGPGGETGSAPPPVVSDPDVSWVRLGPNRSRCRPRTGRSRPRTGWPWASPTTNWVPSSRRSTSVLA
jgi:hypothetical protein